MAKKEKELSGYDPFVIDQVVTPVPNTGDKNMGKPNKTSKSSKPVSGDRGGDHVLHAKKPEGAQVIRDHPKSYFGTGRNGYKDGTRKSGR